MPNFIRITPFLHVDDVASAVAFFRDILGFSVWIKRQDYAYVQRETAGLRIGSFDTQARTAGTRSVRSYIDVQDVDALYAELKPRLDTLPTGHVHGPVDQDYGQREFMVFAPDGNLVVFGQGIVPTPDEPIELPPTL